MTTAVILALGTGLPVIATRHSGFTDQIVDGKNGYLAHEDDYEDLAEKILEYINHPDRWAGMSKAARQHALKHYDRKVTVPTLIDLYRRLAPRARKVAFVVGVFPSVSEAWLINLIADLEDYGIDVCIYAFRKGDQEHVSERYFSYRMEEKTVYLDMPSRIVVRAMRAIPKFFRMVKQKPRALKTIFNLKKHGRSAFSLKLLYWTEPFLSMDADVIHCHFGMTANRFLIIREALNLSQSFLTSFYGVDVSRIPKIKGAFYYDNLQKECSCFLVMSNDMKTRVAGFGFPEERLIILPVSEDVNRLPYKERTLGAKEFPRIISVGRLVEKKGFDDLIRAIAIVKKRYHRPFSCTIVGGGVLEKKLRMLAERQGVSGVLDFKGYLSVQKLVPLLMDSHLYVQSSKKAADGDME